MVLKINKKIVGFRVINEKELNKKQSVDVKKVVHQKMNEAIKRPDSLRGTTYKIKPPQLEHAFYITINDILLNKGTEYETRLPFEIFLNSKNMEHFQWTIALTLIISSVFRKGGDITFLVKELKSVFDPHGGYFKSGKYIPSLVSEIGCTIEKHLRKIGFLSEKQFKKDSSKDNLIPNNENSDHSRSNLLCINCNTKSMVRIDSCDTCLSCGYSKCG